MKLDTIGSDQMRSNINKSYWFSGKQQKKKTSNKNEIKRLHSSEFNIIVPYDNESYEEHYGALECLKSQLFLVRQLFDVLINVKFCKFDEKISNANS